jgi:hypothetical protein
MCVQISQDPTRSSWGGARAGAGRPARSAIASEPHQVRPPLSAHHPVHVVARVVAGVALRGRRAQRAVRRALGTSLARADFRIVELAVLPHAIELVVEADDRVALARGMQGFEVAAAKHFNRAASRRGSVFADRYRARSLATRPAVRAALASLPARRTRAAWPQTWLLLAYSAYSSSGSFGVGGDTDSSGIRYSSPSHRPRSTS